MITGKDIKDQSIKAKDLDAGSVTTNKVKNKTLKLKDLSSEVTAKLGRRPGCQGPQGAGPRPRRAPRVPTARRPTPGRTGASSTATSSVTATPTFVRVRPPTGRAPWRSPRWASAASASAPVPTTDKTAFGNEVDFQGKTLASISSVSFWEYTTAENRARTPSNLASVAMEINPANGLQTYSTLNYIPSADPAGAWTKITADQKQWYLTGAAGTASGCNQVTYCTLGEVKTALPNATLYTVAITKGSDYAFSGAVDALQINSTTYDFEPFGVIAKTS